MSPRRSPSRPKRKVQHQSDPPSKPARRDRLPILVAAIVVPVVAACGYVFFSGGGSETVKNSTSDPKLGEASQQDTGAAAALDTAPTWETTGTQSSEWNKMDNPAGDGWDTEVFAAQISAQLEDLKKLVVHPVTLNDLSSSQLVSPNAQIKLLRPAELRTIFRDDVLHVRRGEPGSLTEPLESPTTEAGAAALLAAVDQIRTAYSDPDELRVKLKVFRIERRDDLLVTHQTAELFGRTESGLLEENAVWIAGWRPRGQTPELVSLQPAEYESVERFGGTLFSDCTESALGKTVSFQEQLLQGYNHWLERSQFHRFLSILGNPGIAVGDVNADGLEDLYVCQEAGLPNLLYIQNADGSLMDASRQSGADFLQNASAALIVDWNNDGRQDLAVAVTGGVVIASGNGKGQFSIEQILDTGDHIMVLSAADYDRDGRLDLYAGAYFPDGAAGETETIVPGSGGQFGDGGEGGRNSLFRNETTEAKIALGEVTEAVGLDASNHRYTLAAAWEDYDNDGDQDLYVSNDYGWNNLFRHDQQADGTTRFVDVAVEAGAQDNAFGMSVSWSDYDRDGWMDLYVSNMYSYAGNRITFQQQFKSDVSAETKRRFQRLARGNTLLKNLGRQSDGDELLFQDRSVEAAVNQGRWAWGSCFVDINNDGWDDLVVANGYITTDDSGDL